MSKVHFKAHLRGKKGIYKIIMKTSDMKIICGVGSWACSKKKQNYNIKHNLCPPCASMCEPSLFGKFTHK